MNEKLLTKPSENLLNVHVDKLNDKVYVIDTVDQKARQLELEVTNVMQQLGIPAHLKGYQYIRYAVLASIEDPELLGSMTKGVYVAVAEHFGSTPSRVERGIRVAVKASERNCEPEVLTAFLGNPIGWRAGRITNGRYICSLVDYFRIRL